MVYKIFLSHSSVDRDWVEWITVNAKNIGIDVYLYEHDHQPGTLIADKLKRAIRDSDTLVVLLTHNSQFSSYVQQEIGFAEASGKRIIPLVQPGIQEQSLAMLEGREYIPFDFYNPEKALSTLLRYLQQLKKVKENEQAVLMGIVGLIFLAWLLGRKE
ncbi:MAG: toll/interleukin-1 receptor domain-containing protein [Methanosarcinales archaeon Met12]|nr:MAG: toll/interleukin-1 receptor domain-containing protein [Methanosarcinales archaeon Met12]